MAYCQHSQIVLWAWPVSAVRHLQQIETQAAEDGVQLKLVQVKDNMQVSARSHTSPLRFEDFYAARTQPQPELPEGSSHKLSANYYYSRDGRREVDMPTLLASPNMKLIEGKQTETKPIGVKNTPGSQWKWD